MARASTELTMSEIIVQRVRTKYQWPAVQLNFWLFIMLVASCTVLGISADFITVQKQLEIGIPWYFTYWICSAGLGIIFILLMLFLISQRRLLPGVVMLGSFILFVLWLVGLIVISIQLWGPEGSIANDCSLDVNGNEFRGQSVAALAWLEQSSICQSWKASWAFELIGTIFFFWMMVMAYQVYRVDI